MKLQDLRKRFKKALVDKTVTIELPTMPQATFATATGGMVTAVGDISKPDRWYVVAYEDIRAMSSGALEEWMLYVLRQLDLPYDVTTAVAHTNTGFADGHIEITFTITVGQGTDMRYWNVVDFTVRATAEYAAFTVPAPELMSGVVTW